MLQLPVHTSASAEAADARPRTLAVRGFQLFGDLLKLHALCDAMLSREGAGAEWHVAGSVVWLDLTTYGSSRDGHTPSQAPHELCLRFWVRKSAATWSDAAILRAFVFDTVAERAQPLRVRVRCASADDAYAPRACAQHSPTLMSIWKPKDLNAHCSLPDGSIGCAEETIVRYAERSGTKCACVRRMAGAFVTPPESLELEGERAREIADVLGLQRADPAAGAAAPIALAPRMAYYATFEVVTID